MKFQKSMIAVAVMAMAAGVHAETITEITDGFQYDKAEDLTVNLQQFNVFNNVNIQANSVTINGPKKPTDLNTLYAGGPVNLTSKVGDVVIHAEAKNAIFTAPQADNPTNASVKITSARDILIGSDSGWAIMAQNSDSFAGISVNAARDVIINSANGVTNNAGAKGKVEVKGTNVIINAQKGNKAVSGTFGETVIEAKNDLTINGGKHSAVTALDGTLTLKAKGKTTINGDINFDRASATSPNATEGTINILDTGTTVINGNVVAKDGGTMNITLAGAGSQLNGAIKTDKTEQDLTPTTNIGLKDGATWNAKAESHVTKLTLAGGVVDRAIS